MTIQEFHNNFNIEVDKTRDFEFPYIQPEQIDYWLNKAQDQYIESHAYPKDPNVPGFEQTQKRVDDLSKIVTTSNAIPQQTSNGYIFTLPTNYRHLVRHRCTTITECGTKTVGGEQVTHEFINQMLKDPFWWPTGEEPLYYFSGNTIVYETKGNFTMNLVTIDYIKVPAQMRYGTTYAIPTTDINCELAENVHSKILDIAVSMVLENFESQRYQTNLNENNKLE